MINRNSNFFILAQFIKDLELIALSKEIVLIWLISIWLDNVVFRDIELQINLKILAFGKKFCLSSSL